MMPKAVHRAKLKFAVAQAWVAAGFVEHVGFVALAFVEVFALGHGAVQIVSAVLLVSGGAAVARERKEAKARKARARRVNSE